MITVTIILEFIFCNFTISQNLRQKASPNCLPSVYRDNRASTIFVLEEMMAAFFTFYFEPESLESSDEVAASY